MSLLKLTYSLARDKFQTVTLIGDPDGIRNLYWQLTRNHSSQDGTAIGEIKVTDLDGIDCTREVFSNPHGNATPMCRLEK
jgi:hypothetical protein